MVVDRRVAEGASHTGMTVGRVTLREQRPRPVKASERVAQQIVRDMVDRGMQTGDRLALETDMVAQYNVSRSSLREALRLLEMQGLISLKPGPGGGPVVGMVEPSHLARTAALYFHLSGATYRQLMATQVLLESTCAALASANPDRMVVLAPYLGPAGFDHVDEYRDLTTGYHGAVYELADNPVLSLLTQAVTHTVTQHVVANMDPVDLREAILDEHTELAQVIASGDADHARKLTTEHFERQHEVLRARWPQRIDELIEWR